MLKNCAVVSGVKELSNALKKRQREGDLFFGRVIRDGLSESYKAHLGKFSGESFQREEIRGSGETRCGRLVQHT